MQKPVNGVFSTHVYNQEVRCKTTNIKLQHSLKADVSAQVHHKSTNLLSNTMLRSVKWLPLKKKKCFELKFLNKSATSCRPNKQLTGNYTQCNKKKERREQCKLLGFSTEVNLPHLTEIYRTVARKWGHTAKYHFLT